MLKTYTKAFVFRHPCCVLTFVAKSVNKKAKNENVLCFLTKLADFIRPFVPQGASRGHS